MAACSSARSAYIRLSLACSASSSRSCRTSDTDAPPYLLRHLKNVALLTPCVRHRSGTGTPLSASRRMPTIWVSLNLDFRMTAPWTRAVYVQLSIDRGSLRAEDASNDELLPGLKDKRLAGPFPLVVLQFQKELNRETGTLSVEPIGIRLRLLPLAVLLMAHTGQTLILSRPTISLDSLLREGE